MRLQSRRGWFFISICDDYKIAWFHIVFGKFSIMLER